MAGWLPMGGQIIWLFLSGMKPNRVVTSLSGSRLRDGINSPLNGWRQETVKPRGKKKRLYFVAYLISSKAISRGCGSKRGLPRPISYRGQLINAGGIIDRSTLFVERAVPQTDPDVCIYPNRS